MTMWWPKPKRWALVLGAVNTQGAAILAVLAQMRKDLTMTFDEFRVQLKTVAEDLAAEGQKLSELAVSLPGRTDVPQDIVDAITALDGGIKTHTDTIATLGGTPPTA